MINICSWNVGLWDCDGVVISFIWYMRISKRKGDMAVYG